MVMKHCFKSARNVQTLIQAFEQCNIVAMEVASFFA